MKKVLFLIPLLIFSNHVFSQAINTSSKIEDSIKRLNWNGVDVVYIEDNRFPTFDLTLYFADGALSESSGENGLTEHSFSLIDSGTDKLSQAEILDQFEFTGSEFSSSVTHEYSTISISGLTKDMNTTFSQACSLLRNANYPEKVIKKEIDLERESLLTLVASPQGLAERVFREISMGQTPYSYPVSGKLNDFASYTPTKLRSKMNYFLDNVKKRIYLTGPSSVLSLEKILTKECQLKGTPQDFVRSMEVPVSKTNKTTFIFVPVPDANQVQLRIGRFLNANEIQYRNLDALASDFLGGGFTSKLMREVRTKRGLTYSIGSFIASQKQYGRSGISTFTKNETINRLIEVIDETVSKIAKNGISKEDLEHSSEGMIGSYPFKFESNSAFLSQLLLLDHIARPYSDLFEFKESVAKVTAKEVAQRIKDVYGFDKQIIFVLGDKSIESSLRKLTKKYGNLEVIDYKKYL